MRYLPNESAEADRIEAEEAEKILQALASGALSKEAFQREADELEREFVDDDIEKGGPGSGHHGHKGIPGHKGGSQPKEGGPVEDPNPSKVVHRSFDVDSTFADIDAHFKHLGFKTIKYGGAERHPEGAHENSAAHKIANNIDYRPEDRAKVAEIATRASQALTKLRNDGLPMPDTLLLYHDPWNNDTFGAFDISTSGETFIAINTGATGHEEAIKEYGGSGWWSSAESDSVMTHELGHFYHYLKSPVRFAMSHILRGQPLRRGELPEYLRTKAYDYLGVLRKLHDDGDLAHHIGNKVSRYALRTTNEFVAEVFSGMRAGKNYDKTVMNYYRKLGGPFVEDFKGKKN